MPLNSSTRVTGAPALIDFNADVDGDGVGYFDALPAAFRRENATLNLAELAERKIRFGISQDEDDIFNAYENTEGTIVEEFPDAMVGVNSQEEKDFVIQQLHREKRDLEILDASGGMGVLAMLTAGILDPIMFAPVGAAFRATRVARMAANGAKVTPGAVRTAAITARAGMLASSAAEIPLQLNQETRTATESAINIGAATVLSGLLGGVGAKFSTELRENMLKDIDRDLGGSVAGGSDIRLDPSDLAPGVGGSESAATVKVAQGFGIPTLIAKARFSPMLSRLIDSPVQETKRALLRLGDQPVIVNGFDEGPSVERLLKKYTWTRDELGQAERDLFKKYKQRTKGQKFQMKRKEFVRNAGESQRVDSDAAGFTKEGRVIIEPEAKELAQIHNKLYEDFAQQMVDLRMLPEEVIEQGPKFATRYLRRRYLRDKIQRDRDATGTRKFERRVRAWLKETLTDEDRAYALRARPDLPEEEAVTAAIDHGAESITDHIVGLAPGQGVVGRADIPGGSPLQNRVMSWSDETVVDYLDNDISNLTDQYIRTVGARLELFKMDAKLVKPLPVGTKVNVGRNKFITVKEGDVIYPKGKNPSHLLPNTIQAIREEYRPLFESAQGEKAIAKLQRKMDKDIEVVEAMRDRLLGTFGSTPGFGRLKSAARVARAVTQTSQLGGVTMSSIPDAAMNTFRHGLNRTMRTAVRSSFNPKQFKMSMAEAKLTGAVSEMSQRVRFLELAELGGANADNAIEAASQKMAGGFGMVTLMSPWNQFWKGFSGAVFQTRLIEVSQAIASGGKVKATDLADLAQVRIGKDMARRIAAQLNSPNGMGGSGAVKYANTAAWTDDGARSAYRSAVGQQIDNTILTPGIADRPLFMSAEWGKSVGQYKSFAFAATNRILVTGAQNLRAGDLYKLNGLLLMITLGALVEDSKRFIAGRPQEEDRMKWWLAGLDRSGTTGILSDGAQIADKLGISILPGGPISSRFAARNLTSSLLGPTAGLAETATRSVRATTEGFTEGDVKALVRAIPYNNLFYWKAVLGKLPAEAAADAFNVPRRRRN